MLQHDGEHHQRGCHRGTQADLVEPPPAPRRTDRQGDGGDARDQAGFAVRAVQVRDHVQRQDDVAGPHGHADNDAEPEHPAHVSQRENAAVAGDTHAPTLSHPCDRFDGYQRMCTDGRIFSS